MLKNLPTYYLASLNIRGGGVGIKHKRDIFLICILLKRQLNSSFEGARGGGGGTDQCANRGVHMLTDSKKKWRILLGFQSKK